MMKRAYLALGVACLSFGTSGCLESTAVPSSTSTTSAATLTPASGVMAAKIIFRTGNTGSFDTPSNANGTPVGAGFGHRAVRIFNADNSLLSNDSTASTWPGWLTLVEIGLTGSNNTNGTNQNCARFASGESAITCDFDADGAADAAGYCGTPVDGYFRVSEYDCSGATTVTSPGSATDPVYIRINISRDTSKLAAHENLMGVLEYSASSLHPAPVSPSSCFAAGTFTPDDQNCSDQNWNVFMRASTTTTVNPFLMLVPPSFSYLLAYPNTTTPAHKSTQISTKQFILPIAADTSINTIQLSRVAGTNDFTINGNTVCTNNSPLCVGMIFYSLTLYRM